MLRVLNMIGKMGGGWPDVRTTQEVQNETETNFDTGLLQQQVAVGRGKEIITHLTKGNKTASHRLVQYDNLRCANNLFECPMSTLAEINFTHSPYVVKYRNCRLLHLMNQVFHASCYFTPHSIYGRLYTRSDSWGLVCNLLDWSFIVYCLYRSLTAVCIQIL